MVDQKKVAAAVEEIKALNELFDKIKKDSEELFSRSKALSETGVQEAHELIEAARSNWEKIVHNFSATNGLTKLIGSAFKGKKSGSSKKAAPAKKGVAAKASKTSKKASAKKAKKTRK